MNAVARRRIRMPGATVRELVLLAAGVGLVIAGATSRPRDPATIGAGTALLLATPAVGPRDDDDGGSA